MKAQIPLIYVYFNIWELLLCLKSKVLSNGEFEAQEDILKVFLEKNVCVEVYNISIKLCAHPQEEVMRHVF